jgi:AraC-like DNA-binding protein
MGDRTKDAAEPVHVRAVMGELALSGRLSVSRVAEALELSPRTLQRRLSRHETTFRDLVADVRMEAARTLLLNTDMPVHQVARRLGYRTHGAFARAFLAWTGCSPRQFRKGAAACTRVARNGQTD